MAGTIRKRLALRSALALAALGAIATAANIAAAEGAGEARVRADLERYLRARVADPNASIEMPPLAGFAAPSELPVEALRTELSTRAVPPLSGRVSITVALYSGERLLQRGVVSPYVRVVETVVVPNRDLRRGDVLAREDLRVVKRDRARLPSDPLRRPADAVGLRVTRSVRRDAVMRRSQLERIPLVERGDRVTIVLESGPLTIRGAGRAQEPGAVGDWIRVVNLDSRREISGRIDREGRVHVAF